MFGGGKMQPGMKPIFVDKTSTFSSTIPAKTAAETSDDVLVAAIDAELLQLLGENRYKLWIDGKIRLTICDDTLTIAVGSPFLQTWMQRQFKQTMTEAAQAVLGHSATVVFAVDATVSSARAESAALANTNLANSELAKVTGVNSAADRATLTNPAAPSEPAQTQPSARPVMPRSSSELNRAIATADSPMRRTVVETTVGAIPGSGTRSAGPGQALAGQGRGRRLADLSDFVAGPQTELALTAARQVAAGQVTMFNPLYLHGPVGSGKTHLLEGICRQLKRATPTSNVMLLTSEAFANYFTQALRDRTLPSFRQRFRSVDVLLVDDVEFFESKRVFQEEFLHTFTELVDHGRQVVLTGSRHPRLLNKLGDDLATRFLSGLVCRLETPDLSTRQQIVDSKASRMSADFAPEALNYVANRFQTSVRELEGALNCLQTYYSMTHKRVTLSTARQVLADLERDCLRIVRLADIERVICHVFGVKPKELQSESRVRTVSQPRMLAMFLARKHTQAAYTEIGQHFGGRNHSTVMSAERKVQQWLDENSTIQVASQSWTIGEILSTIEQQLLAG